MLRREVVIKQGDPWGKYYVDGFINGRGPIKFNIDTGASGVSITDEIADSIGLDWRSGQKGSVRGIISETDNWTFPVKSVRIGDIEVRNLVCYVTPEMELGNIDGLIGMSFLERIGFTQDDGVLILHDDSLETMPESSSDNWWGKDSPEDEGSVSVEDNSKQESAATDEVRKEELAQAEHEAKLAQIKVIEADAKRKVAVSEQSTPMVYEADRDGDGEITREEKIAHETGGGVLGFWWLTGEEAVTIGVSAMLVLFTLGMGMLISSLEVDWDTVDDGAVLLGTSWWEQEYEMEDCKYDEYNDEYYDCIYWYEYECGADVVYEFTAEGAIYSDEDGISLGWWDDYCLEEVEFNVLPLGSTVEVWYEKGNPENSQLDAPMEGGIVIFLCCMPFFLLILMVTLINARFSNTPKYTDLGQDVIGESDPGTSEYAGSGGVVHHHHHGRAGWGRRMFFGTSGRHRTRTRRRSGGRSSGGRRSTGGRRSSGGGGRRSSGGGGRRSSGGRRR
ncbi:MAG: retropepsin-like aspartic protease family protein [Candidatus Thalassarchaeaceae archaeon]